MEYIQGLSEQLKVFLWGIGLGFLLGAVYDFFKILRICMSLRGVTVICDLLYSLLVTAATFCFVLAFSEGEIRFYIFLAEILGWLIWFFTFSAFVGRAAQKIKAFFVLVSMPFRFIKDKIKFLFIKIKDLIKKERKKSVNN